MDLDELGFRHYVTYVMADPSRIFETITEADRNADWYMPCLSFGRRKGARCAWGPKGEPVITGEIIACRARAGYVAHTFRFAFLEEPDSEVRWRVTPMGAITQVWLRHQLAGRPQTHGIVAGSWNVILAALKTLMETGKRMPEPEWPSEGWDRDPV